MKVFLYYEDNDNPALHKTLKITLPKSWKVGPTSKLLQQFVDSYNDKKKKEDDNDDFTLSVEDLHLSMKKGEGLNDNDDNGGDDDDSDKKLIPLANDDILIETIPDRANVYICHGPSQTRSEIQALQQSKQAERQQHVTNTISCTHYGCNQRFPPGGPYPEKCIYHKSPPIFHETAKYWSCCPNKKAYDWDDFQSIPGCMTGKCSEIKDEENSKGFLGGCDVREQLTSGGSNKLKSIDDFNKAQLQQQPQSNDGSGGDAGGGGVVMSSPTSSLERLRNVLKETMDVDEELFDQVVTGMRKEIRRRGRGRGGGSGDDGMVDDDDDVASAAVVDGEVRQRLGKEIKNLFQSLAVQQLRIK